MDKSKPWGYFDGSIEGDPPICGCGDILFYIDSHYIKLKGGQGEGSKNFTELMVLKHLFLVVVENGCRAIQIFGDSMTIINWTLGIQ